MKRIKIYDWNTGFHKVGFTNFLRTEFGYGLREAKDATNTVLTRRPVSIEVSDDKIEEVVLKLNQLGARFELDVTSAVE